jgi:hypothetical protein
MEKQELEVYSAASNAAVVRAPGRRFPGVVVQGDTLSTLHAAAAFVAERVRDSADEELAGEAAMVRDRLAGLLAHYEAVLGAHGLGLPYHRAV